GRVVSRLTTDVDVLQEMFAAGAMTIVLDVLGLVGIVAVMLGMDWRLALTSLGLLPVIVGAVDFFRRQVRRTYRMIRERIARINGYLQEAITGMTAIALANREVRAFAEFERLNADHRDAYHLSNKLEAALFSFVEAMSTVSIAMLLWEGGRLTRGEEWVLRDVSFRVAAGEHVAIVGATGSGKTTLVKLLDRLYDVGRGRILVDGIDVRDWDPQALRRRIAVVLQEVFLFSGPVET